MLVSNGISAENREKLETFSARVGVELSMVEASGVDLSQFPLFERWSAGVWLKFFLADLAPAGCSRLLYLDCDMVVTDDLTGLMETDLSGRTLAAIPDATLDRMSARKRELGMPETGTYFNTGSLLIDPAAWRKNDITTRAETFARNNRDIIRFPTQDVLCAVAWQDILPIHGRWNFIAKTNRDPLVRPAVLHFIGKEKPWKMRNAPGAGIYRLYRSMTPWSDYSVPRSIPRSFQDLREVIQDFRCAMLARRDLKRNDVRGRRFNSLQKSFVYHMELNRPGLDRLCRELARPD